MLSANKKENQAIVESHILCKSKLKFSYLNFGAVEMILNLIKGNNIFVDMSIYFEYLVFIMATWWNTIPASIYVTSDAVPVQLILL